MPASEKVQYAAVRVREYLVRLCDSPDLHFGNRIFLDFLAGRIVQNERLARWAGDTADPSVAAGLAGILLLAAVFGHRGALASAMAGVRCKLMGYADEKSRYAGYVFSGGAENQRYGLLHGLAGVGLAECLEKGG